MFLPKFCYKARGQLQHRYGKINYTVDPLFSISTLFLDSIILYQVMTIKNHWCPNFIKVLYTVHVVQNCRQNKSRMLLSIVWFSVIFLLFLGPLTGTQIQHRECIQVRIQSDPSSQSLRHGTRPE